MSVKMNNCLLGKTEMRLPQELAATASARPCLWVLLQKPGVWKLPRHWESGAGVEATAKSGPRLGGVCQSWVVLALPTGVAVESWVSCFAAGVLCDLFF